MKRIKMAAVVALSLGAFGCGDLIVRKVRTPEEIRLANCETAIFQAAPNLSDDEIAKISECEPFTFQSVKGRYEAFKELQKGNTRFVPPLEERK